MKESRKQALKNLPDWDEFADEAEISFYETYDEAAHAAQNLGIVSVKQYQKEYKRDPRLPSHPSNTYKGKGWISWLHFLRGEHREFYPTYDEAACAARKLGITGPRQYRREYKRDPRLPSQPYQVYQDNGWISWSVFLTGEKKQDFYTHDEAASASRSLGITNHSQYKKEYNRDPRLPSHPEYSYKDKGWISWSYFLTEEHKQEFYPTYDVAADVIRSMGIASDRQYLKNYKRDHRLPSSPHVFYRNKGWISWPHFLGTNRIGLTYDEAAVAARKLKIKTCMEFFRRHKENPRLPANPDRTYRNKGWISWPHFLTGVDLYPTYNEAVNAIRKLRIKTRYEFKEKYKLDPCLPCNPSNVYQNKGWVSWPYFLTGKHKQIHYPTYNEASAAARKIKIKVITEYRSQHCRDPRLPANPDQVYKGKGWISWPHFLTGKERNYYLYKDATTAAQKLGIKTSSEYKYKYEKDSRLPSNPDIMYKNIGWVSWPHFLIGHDLAKETSCSPPSQTIARIVT